MALDVQPLSAKRRAAMLLALLLLFAASLGFAELLVRRRPGALQVNWHLPNGPFRRVLHTALEEATGGEVWQGEVHGGKRQVVGLVEDLEAGQPQVARVQAAEELFAAVMGVEPGAARPAPLAGRAGVEIEGATDDGGFGLLRLIVVDQTMVAICYRGAGKITDADRQYWDELCAHVEIRGLVSRTGA